MYGIQSFLFQIHTSQHIKVRPLLYMHAKVHENAVVDAMVMCSYKWPTNNVHVSSMRLTYSLQDSLFHSESIHIDFKLTMPRVQELWPLQEGLHEQDWEKLGKNNLELRREMPLQLIKVNVTDEILSI